MVNLKVHKSIVDIWLMHKKLCKSMSHIHLLNIWLLVNLSQVYDVAISRQYNNNEVGTVGGYLFHQSDTAAANFFSTRFVKLLF